MKTSGKIKKEVSFGVIYITSLRWLYKYATFSIWEKLKLNYYIIQNIKFTHMMNMD
jgi:hypothetical protein